MSDDRPRQLPREPSLHIERVNCSIVATTNIFELLAVPPSNRASAPGVLLRIGFANRGVPMMKA